MDFLRDQKGAESFKEELGAKLESLADEAVKLLNELARAK